LKWRSALPLAAKTNITNAAAMKDERKYVHAR